MFRATASLCPLPATRNGSARAATSVSDDTVVAMCATALSLSLSFSLDLRLEVGTQYDPAPTVTHEARTN